MDIEEEKNSDENEKVPTFFNEEKISPFKQLHNKRKAKMLGFQLAPVLDSAGELTP